MFEKHKAEKAAREYQKALAEWQKLRDGYADFVEVAQSFNGIHTDELILKDGEALFCNVGNCSLVEERRGQGHYQGGSTGVSIPIGSIGGRSVRYRVGATRGHYVQGAPVPTSIDTGTVYITNQRVVFVGNNQTRECLFAKTIGISHDDTLGETTISVSNRQKPTVIHYGPAIAGEIDFRIELALAHFKGTVPQFVSQIRTELAQIEAERPKEPAVVGASAVATGSATQSIQQPPSVAQPPLLPPSRSAPSPSSEPPPPNAAPRANAPTPASAAPPPPSGYTLPHVPPADHDAGWEWVYFASELARGLAACQSQYIEYQSQATAVSGTPVSDPATNIRVLSDEMSAVVQRANGFLDPALIEKALGPPGQPGDEDVIRTVTAGLTGVYADMISWGLRVRAADVGPKWQPAYSALSKYVSEPLHQFQDFSAALSATMSQLATEVRAGKTPNHEIDMTLTLTIDPAAISAFNAAMAPITAS